MKPIELACQYLDIFFGGGSMESLRPLFQSDLVFEGPFFQGCSADEYINSLKQDPPRGMSYKIISSYQTKSDACVIYTFHKSGVSTKMAQKFDVRDGKISKILLIFDSDAFAQPHRG